MSITACWRFPVSRRGMAGLARRESLALLAVLALAALLDLPARADHDPARTATIYVHGFDLAGASRAGIYGDESHEPVADSIAALLGLPISAGGDGPLSTDV